tara:strand:+ start:271 stop:1395 length:1125 start_codon:yes stop_codon:yes gene_type:complete
MIRKKILPFIPLAVPDLRGKHINMLSNAIKDNMISSAGPAVEKFESLIAKELNSKFALATITGSAALHLALKIFDIGRGHKVLVPDFTFAATINSVIVSGAEPILVDVNRETWTLDVDLTEKAVKKFKPRAIIVVHTLGHPAQMDELNKIALENNIILIEDAAGAIGAKYKNKLVGSLSDAGIFSFNGNKVFTTGAGGAVVLNKKGLYKKGKTLYTQARKRGLYDYSDVGYNYKMPSLTASLGISQIPFLKKLIKKKRIIADKYDSHFSAIKQFNTMPRKKWAQSSCWLYSLQFKSTSNAKAFTEYLLSKKVGAKLFWNALSKQKPYKKYKSILCGTASALSNKIVSIPCSTSLNDDEQNKVINVVESWSQKNQ